MKHKLSLILIISIFVFSNLLTAQNDVPCNAINLGFLPTNLCVPASTSPYTIINTNANNEITTQQYNYCSNGTVFKAPTADIWYKFTVISENLLIKLTSAGSIDITSPQYTIYSSNNGLCNTLLPIQCFASNNPTLIDTVFGLLPLQTYYLQISGKDLLDKGTAFLYLSGFTTCPECIVNSFLSIEPLASNGSYPPGTEVQMCAIVNGFSSANNALHGVVPIFGDGWDLTSFTNLNPQPYIVSGSGEWNFNAAAPTPIGVKKGYFFEPFNSLDANPGNNSGEASNNSTTWIFCWKIKTKTTSCLNEKNLAVNIRLYNDGETGSKFPNNSCSIKDNNLSYFATRNCCATPLNYTLTPSSCIDSCDGKITISPTGSLFNFQILDTAGNVVSSVLNASSLTKNLCAGVYSIHIHDIQNGCDNFLSFEIKENDKIIALQNVWGCPNLNQNEAFAQPMYNFGNVPFTYEWKNVWPFPAYLSTSQTATGMHPGVYTIKTWDKNLCGAKNEVIVFDKIKDFVTFSYPQQIYCKTDTNTTPTYFPKGGTFSSQPAGLTININTGKLDLSTSSPGIYNISYNSESTANKCGDTTTVSIEIKAAPSSPSLSKSSVEYCLGLNTDTIIASNNPQGTVVVWLDQSLNVIATGSYFIPSFTNIGQKNVYVVSYDPNTGCYSQPVILTVNVKNGTAVDAGENQTICYGHIALLEAKSNASEILWQPGIGLSDSSAHRTQASPEKTTMYYAYAKSVDGCKGIDSVLVTIVNTPECDLKIYSGFTPNKDGSNDTWIIDGIRLYSDNNVKIFNRWGNSVFSVNNYDNHQNVWKGKNNEGNNLPSGTYYYIVDIGNKQYKGWVELTR